MAKFNVSVCPVCDAANFSHYLTCTDHFVSGEKFDIKECISCGFKITENIEDEQNIGRYYESEKYISHSNTSKGIVNAVYHRVRNYMLRKKRRLTEQVAGTKKVSILDVGAGTGFFLNEMSQNGWQVSGTEKSSGARQFAKSEFGLELNETSDLFKMKDKTIDVITLWHVLEHIHDLGKNMQAFHRLLTKEGKLIIAVPNHLSYDAKHYREYWAAYDVPRHIWHFAPKQMELLGKKYNFKLAGIKPMPFDSFYISLLSEKYKKSKVPFLGGIIHGKISWLKSLTNPQNCSSVIYIFEKN